MTEVSAAAGEAPEAFAARFARRAPGLLRDFNAAGLLAASDVHVALRLARLGEETDERVALAAALAVRAARLGHVYVDLARIPHTAALDVDDPVDLVALPWPAPAEWARALEASPLVAVGDGDAGPVRPLRLLGTRLHLDRYWREERQIADDLRALAAPAEGVADDVLADGIARMFSDPHDERQRAAAEAAVRRRLAVIAGEPGTGKTTTVARIVALLHEQAAGAGGAMPVVALAAPTAKAAQRLEEAVQEEARRLDVSDAVREELLAARASTLHRLLGARIGGDARFRHHRGNRLPHDVVVVDETSMVSLSLMARVVESVRRGARLILVGDPAQLASIEAGVVLADIVGPAADGADPPAAAPLAGGIVVLDHPYRFGAAITKLAAAVRAGDGDAVIDVLRSEPEGVQWLPVDAAEHASAPALEPVRGRAVGAAQAIAAAAAVGDAEAALASLAGFRILCAHRRGDHGVSAWSARVESWLGDSIGGPTSDSPWYVGRPLLVTKNDHSLPLYNGDTGVVVADDSGGMAAAFRGRDEVILHRPSRLEAVETVYAMTIHKSQGSQFDSVAVLLPTPDSRILSRELLYTAVTRVRTQLILVGTEETIRAAVARPVERASGLRRRLWGE